MFNKFIKSEAKSMHSSVGYLNLSSAIAGLSLSNRKCMTTSKHFLFGRANMSLEDEKHAYF